METLIQRLMELYDEEKYTEALVIGRWILKALKDISPLKKAFIAYNHGCILSKLHMYEQAVEYFSITTNTLFSQDRNNPLYVDALQHLAIAHHESNHGEKAIYLQHIAIGLLERGLSKDSEPLLDAKYNLAQFFLYEAAYEDALHLLEEISTLYNRHTLGIIDTYMSMAFCYEEENEFLEAFRYVKKSLYQVRKLFGEDHEEFIAGLLYAARILYDAGDFKKALRYGNRALALITRGNYSNKGKIEISDFLSDLAYDNGNLEKAIRHKKDAILYFKAYSGENHLVLANDYNKLAQLYHEKGQKDLASMALEKALKIKSSLLGKHHVSYLKDALTACLFWLDNEEYTKAYTYVYEMFSTFQKDGTDHDFLEAESLLAVLNLFENIEEAAWHEHKDEINVLMDQLEDARSFFEEE